MTDLDGLRTGLRHLAAEVEQVDLGDRVQVSSRRLGRRRAATAVATALAVVAVAFTAVTEVGHGTGPIPAPPISNPPVGPTPTTLPTFQEPPSPDLSAFQNVTLTVPSWGTAASACPTGRLDLSGGAQYYQGPDTRAVNVEAYVVADVNGDGAPDYVALLSCGEGPESPGRQIVAFQRSGGEMVPLGRVIGTQDGVAMLGEPELRSGNRIAVQIGQEYSDGGMRYVPNQWREYGWQGGHFVQVSGPTSFPAQPASALLSVGSSDLVFHRAAGGPYVGELTVTVRNTGTLDVTRAELTVVVPAPFRPTGDGWTGCSIATYPGTTSFATTPPATTALRCEVPDLTAGSTRKFHLGFMASAVSPAATQSADVENRVDYVYLNQRPPYVFESNTSTMDSPFAIVVS